MTGSAKRITLLPTKPPMGPYSSQLDLSRARLSYSHTPIDVGTIVVGPEVASRIAHAASSDVATRQLTTLWLSSPRCVTVSHDQGLLWGRGDVRVFTSPFLS